MGGGGGGRRTKKKFAQGKVKWKKILARQLILKKCSCYSLKKIHTRNLMTKKKFLRLENSPPPHNFSNVPSLMLQQLNTMSTNRTFCLDLFAIFIMLSMSVKTNLHITVRTCQIERKQIHLTTVSCYQRESCPETIFLTLTGELYISGLSCSKHG